MSRWHPLRLLPNTAGFPCSIKLRDGRVVRARVDRGGVLALPEGVVFADCMGWR